MKIAAIQMNSGVDKVKNLRVAERLIRKAAKNGAKFVTLPEVFNYRSSDKKIRDMSESLQGETLSLIRKLSREFKTWILSGSILERAKGKKSYNTSALINPSGKIVATYRKIHLFDSNVKGSVVKESKRIMAGKNPVVAKIGKYQLGMSICYDLRFPELYRIYAKKEVEIVTIPSSFTQKTGEAHWESLLRARAIENQCYVVAPAHFGLGANGVPTYGHSMIIDPWGKILAKAKQKKEDIIYAEIDSKKLSDVREALPVLKHRRL